ncbi:LAGLIDADG family homing endonuclease [Streptomyces canus]|uniref:LAGLIDADG family homing endonuclease n=1 Tax=Streptomyces canus TaxID=58343 RepID=UPI003CE746BE
MRKGEPQLSAVSGRLSERSWVLTSLGPYPLWRLEGKTVSVARADVPGFVDVAVSSAGLVPMRTVHIDSGPYLMATSDTVLAAGAVRPAHAQAPRRRYGIEARQPRLLGTFTLPPQVQVAAAEPATRVGLGIPTSADWSGEGDARDGYLVGHLIGDGHFTRTTAHLNVWGDTAGPHGVRQHISWCAQDFPRRTDASGWTYLPGHRKWRYPLPVTGLEMVLSYGVAPGRKTPGRLCEEGVAPQFLVGLLKALVDCDGHVEGDPSTAGVSIRLSQSNRNMLLQVQRMLAWLGVRSRLRKGRPASRRPMPDGRGGMRLYASKENWRLIISGADTRTYMESIGFADSEKSGKYLSAIEGHTFYKKPYQDKVASLGESRTEWGMTLTSAVPAWIAVDGIAVALQTAPRPTPSPRPRQPAPPRARCDEDSVTPHQLAQEHRRGMNVTALAMKHALPQSEVRARLAQAGQKEITGRKEPVPNAARDLPRQELEQLYARYETRELAQQLGVQPYQVLDALQRAGIPRRDRYQRLGLERLVSPDELRRQYADASLHELARMYGVSPSTIRNYLIRWNIPRRATGLKVNRP